MALREAVGGPSLWRALQRPNEGAAAAAAAAQTARARRSRTPQKIIQGMFSPHCTAADVRWPFHVVTRLAHTAASPRDDSQRSIAVIGAGISGLTSALYLKRSLPRHRVVLYEKSNRRGGWAYSERINLSTERAGEPTETLGPLIERGPRSLRPAGVPGLAMLDTISSLGLYNDLIKIPKTHPSAKNRFIYLNGKIHVLPSSLIGAFKLLADRSHPAIKAQPLATLARSMRVVEEEHSTDLWQDESIEAFLRRTTGRRGTDTLPLLDYVGSAVLHGIYAADASQLSVRMVMPQLWALPKIYGGLGRAMLPRRLNTSSRPLEELAETSTGEWAQIALRKQQRLDKETETFSSSLGKDIVNEMKGVSIFSFPNGIQTITDAMEQECTRLGVEIKKDTTLDLLATDEGKAAHRLKITSTTGQRSSSDEAFDRVVSALPSRALAKAVDARLPNLAANASSTVAVVNVVLPKSAGVYIPPGFGFLVPRAVARLGDNPMGLIGVVFDSEAVPGQDDYTKLTMMFGGPYWRAGFEAFDLLQAKNDEGAFLDAALSLLSRRLSIDEQLLKSHEARAFVTVQNDCIPTYGPGHLGRMNELHRALQKMTGADAANGLLSVVGASYTGISMNDCVLYARRTAQRIVDAEQSSNPNAIVTGLEELIEG